ncbi:MAG: DUF4276 family protein [Candidatus Hydrogenedentes bacterium]|nr:DUF4276 family protein [Candidatus Hydrogenedentota bacterium]
MRIVLLVEGRTEQAFLHHLRQYLSRHLSPMPKMEARPYNGRIPAGPMLQEAVRDLLRRRQRPVDHVIALTDVYTGTAPPMFKSADDARAKMREWVGQDPRFHPHAAQYDFEAWLIPYWDDLRRIAGHNQARPGADPESINHDNPPSKRLKALFQVGTFRGAYSKPRDADRIFRKNGLDVAIDQCPELKSLVNTILTICGAPPIP